MLLCPGAGLKGLRILSQYRFPACVAHRRLGYGLCLLCSQLIIQVVSREIARGRRMAALDMLRCATQDET